MPEDFRLLTWDFTTKMFFLLFIISYLNMSMNVYSFLAVS
jgi:hypothetical protein